jgi:hypothetical protein
MVRILRKSWIELKTAPDSSYTPNIDLLSRLHDSLSHFMPNDSVDVDGLSVYMMEDQWYP